MTLFVPEHRVFSLLDTGPRIAAPPVPVPDLRLLCAVDRGGGVGQCARGDRRSHRAGCGQDRAGSSRVLAERPATQAAVGEAEAALRAARALYYEAIEETWAAAQREGPVEEPLRLGLRLAATHAVRTSAEVARSMYDLGGGTAIYEDSPLQRRFRDAHAATAHFQVNPATWELTGRVLLGLPTKTAQL